MGPTGSRAAALRIVALTLFAFALVSLAYARLARPRLPAGWEDATIPPPEGAVVITDRVVEVIDGDTIRTARYGRVRYIGIDTPELDASDPRVRRMAQQAREANARLVAGREVRMVLDVQERDRYGRMLAYVWAGDVFVNAYLLRQGYAAVLTVPPNVRFAGRFLELERQARREGRGLWASRADQSL